MQSENRVLRIARRLASLRRLLLRSSASLAASYASYPFRLFHSLFLSSHPPPTGRSVGRPAREPASQPAGTRTHARVRSDERSLRQRLFGISFDRRTDGRAGGRERFVLERAKLKGFQFDKALSANFSSEQLTGINSHFFFHRSPCAPLARSFSCPLLLLSLSFSLPLRLSACTCSCNGAREREREREFLLVGPKSDPLLDFLFDLRSLSSAVSESVSRARSLTRAGLLSTLWGYEICLPESAESPDDVTALKECAMNDRVASDRVPNGSRGSLFPSPRSVSPSLSLSFSLSSAVI